LTTKPAFFIQKLKKARNHSKKRRKIMAPSSPEETRDDFSSICEQFVKFYNHGDAEGLASLYSEDAKILSPNRDFIEGKNAIQTFWQGALEMGIKSFKSEMVDTDSSGNLGFFVGKYTLYSSENQEVDQGKYISVLKNIDGKWKVHRDIYNSSLPLEET
jgi:ketosteroid isomerase-like protein